MKRKQKTQNYSQKKRKKILLFVTSLGIGGAERLVCDLADYYSEQGHEVSIAYLEGREKSFALRSANIKLFHLKLKRNFLSFLAVLLRFRKLIKELQPDVIHSHMYHPNIIARLTRVLVPFERLISTSHSTNEGSKLRMLSYRVTNRFVDVVTAVSDDVAKVLRERGAISGGSVVTVPNGINPSRFSFNEESRKKVRKEFGIKKDDNLIIAAGRLSIPKNYEGLLISISKLIKKRSDFKLLIAGDGPLKEQLLNKLTELNLENSVAFLGVYDDVSALLSAADLFVLSSLWEGLPLVVAEAMSCQRLVVATDCGGVREVLGDCGILVESNNNELLAIALDTALDMEPTLKLEYGQRARERVEEFFSLEANAKAYLELYEDCPKAVA